MRQSIAVLTVIGLLLVAAGYGQETDSEAGAGAEAEEEAPDDGAAADTPESAFRDSVKEQILSGPVEGAEDLTWYWVVLERAGWGFALILLGWVVFRMASLALRRIEMRMTKLVASMSPVESRRQQHVATVLDLVRNIFRYVIIITTAILILDRSLGVNIWPILTGAGIVGIAVAFGSQSLVKDVVTGIFQLLEGQYAVGDYVQIGTAFGKVEDVGLRITRLRDLQDKLYFIPNGTITMVTTYDDPSIDYVLQAPLEKGDQAEEALEAIKALSLDLRSEYPELLGHVDEPEIVTSETGLTSIKMRLGIVPMQDWIVNTEIPARVKQLFAAREIIAPEGRAPTCYVDISPLARMPRGGEK